VGCLKGTPFARTAQKMNQKERHWGSKYVRPNRRKRVKARFWDNVTRRQHREKMPPFLRGKEMNENGIVVGGGGEKRWVVFGFFGWQGNGRLRTRLLGIDPRSPVRGKKGEREGRSQGIITSSQRLQKRF